MQPELPQGYGYVRDPDKKPGEKPDLLFGSDLLPNLTITESGDVDLRAHCTDTSQRSLPACVGNATADTIEILSSLQGYPKVELSRMFIWTLARNMMDVDDDGQGDIDKKTGTYIRLAYDVIHKFGVCLEKYWPYDMSKWNVLPSLISMRKATSRKIKGYYRIRESGDDRVEQILKALRANHPITFGTMIPKDFGKYDGKSTIGIPKETGGGHAMVCVGYDSSKGFIIKNSWGSKWGDGGFGYFSPELMGWTSTWDIWVPTLGKDFRV